MKCWTHGANGAALKKKRDVFFLSLKKLHFTRICQNNLGPASLFLFRFVTIQEKSFLKILKFCISLPAKKIKIKFSFEEPERNIRVALLLF